LLAILKRSAAIKKGGKRCGCLREKDYEHTPALEKTKCLSVDSGKKLQTFSISIFILLLWLF